MYSFLKAADFLLLVFWNCVGIVLVVIYYILAVPGYIVHILWKGIGLLPFIFPLWKKLDNLFNSAALLSMRKYFMHSCKKLSVLLENSAPARVFFFIPVVILFIFMLLYFPPFYLAYSHKYQTGTASWYGPGFYFNRTANGELFIPFWGCTAAHKTLPLGTKVLVKNVKNGKKAVVWINDRGPFVKGRILDLSGLAAWRLGIYTPGTETVEIYTLRKY